MLTFSMFNSKWKSWLQIPCSVQANELCTCSTVLKQMTVAQLVRNTQPSAAPNIHKSLIYYNPAFLNTKLFLVSETTVFT